MHLWQQVLQSFIFLHIKPRARRIVLASTMTTEQQIEERIINIITSPESTIRCVKDGIRYTLIVSLGKKELHISSHWLVDDEKMWVVIYRNHLWGLFKTHLDGIFVESSEASSVLRAVRDKKAAEDAEKREAQAEKERQKRLAFLNTKP